MTDPKLYVCDHAGDSADCDGCPRKEQRLFPDWTDRYCLRVIGDSLVSTYVSCIPVKGEGDGE
jgi:hypothetical protein